MYTMYMLCIYQVIYLTTQVSRPFDYVEPLRQIERLLFYYLGFNK